MKKLFAVLKICAYGIFILCAFVALKVGRDSDILLPVLIALCLAGAIVFIMVEVDTRIKEGNTRAGKGVNDEQSKGDDTRGGNRVSQVHRN